MEGVSRDLQSRSHSVSQVDGVSDMAIVYWLCGGRAQQRDNGSACLDVRHFSFSLFTTGALQAATPVLELSGSASE